MKKRKSSNVDILVVAVARLGGDSHSVHTEDIAIEAYNLAPSRFGWRKYPERIDLELVRRALTSATEKKPPLLAGSVRRGWMLSKAGLEWLKRNAGHLPELSGSRRGSIEEGMELERIRLRDTNAWRKFNEGKASELSRNDYFEFARINEYFSSNKRLERINIVSTAVHDDAELAILWKLLSENFSSEVEKND